MDYMTICPSYKCSTRVFQLRMHKERVFLEEKCAIFANLSEISQDFSMEAK